MKRLFLIAAALALSTVGAHAQAGLRLGQPTYGGTGCPQGTANAVLSPDRTSLSVFYDQYRAAAGASAGRSLDRKSCNLAIPLDVPAGLSVSVLTVDYRGFNALPAGARSVFSVEYFFAGGQGPVFTRTFNGPVTDDFFYRNEGTVVSWSPCGQDVILRTNSSIRVTTTAGREAEATVDTTDIAAALVYRLQWRNC